ncbi:MAG: AAA family ATPase, partial [Muribaculaceae bacterium]|nr:AAA family ATPase [Muribaculaceae bacterium]
VMDKNVMSQLDAELEHAGEETALSPKMLLLEQLRITPEKQLKPMEFLFHLFGKPCFPRRELVAITGKAKSGKTFVTSMLMACCQSRDVLAFQRIGDEPFRVLWYDTEQSGESTQDILKNRVMRMVDGDGKLFDIFNVRGVAWKERRDLLREAVTRCKPDLVIVDGIRDLVNDINDGTLAQEVMEELMHLATEHDCCIVCVLHQNKSGEDHNLRGWIGTELMNKAFEVYSCEKLLPQHIFSLEQTLTRKYDIERTMYFEVGDDGLPVSCGVPTDGGSKDKTDGYPQLNADYIRHDEHDQWQVDVRRLFSDAIGGRQQVTGAELRSEVCRLSNIRSWKFYNSLLEQAVNGEVIMKSYDHAAHVIYALRPQAPVQTELYQDDGEPF